MAHGRPSIGDGGSSEHGSWLQISVEVCGRWSRATSRRVRRDVRSLLEWELPQHLRRSDRVWSATSGDVWVWMPGTPSGEAEAIARRIRHAVEGSPQLDPTCRAAALLTVQRVTYGPDAVSAVRRRTPALFAVRHAVDVVRHVRSL